MDLFEAIAHKLIHQTALVTAPGKTSPRWIAIIAQAYREGMIALAAQSPGGVLFRLTVDGYLEVIGLERAEVEIETPGAPQFSGPGTPEQP